MRQKLRFVALLTLVSFIFAPWIVWTYERGLNPSIKTYGDAIWWWFVSSTTVGYGDIAPVTTMGRLAGVVTIIIGLYGYTNFIAITADSLHSITNQKRLGTATVTATSHIVICEYTAFADELIQALPRHATLSTRAVAIVTDLVQVQPYPQHHFVRGVPISPTALQQANLAAADYVFLFANSRYQDPDLKTLHTLARIQQINPKAKIFVELADPKSELLQHVRGSVTIMPSRALLESVLKHEPFHLAAYLPA